MEVCVPHNTPAYGSSSEPLSPTHYSSGGLSVNDLEACLSEFLNIEELEIAISDVNLSRSKNDILIVVKEDEFKNSDTSKSTNSTSEKCFGNCATFPSLGEPGSSVDGFLRGVKKQEDDKTAEVSEVDSCAKSVSHSYSESTLLPTPLKPASAMKGSRENRGIAPKKLSVKWAPDVYDPIPTSVSHVPKNKNHRHHKNGKRYLKNKQKGDSSSKSSRGSKGKDKDKKQVRKHSGSSTKKYKSLNDDIGVFGFNEPRVGFLYSAEGSDTFCGSSYLKKSVTELHFPVAEAT